MTALNEKEDIMPKDMFDGFDHTQYDAEVRERWGTEAADRSNSWRAGLGEAGQAEFRAANYTRTSERGAGFVRDALLAYADTSL